jgi:hypothetical protein
LTRRRNAGKCRRDLHARKRAGHGRIKHRGSSRPDLVSEDAARVELECLAAGMDDVGIMNDEDIKSRATWAGRIRERMWDYLTDGDPEGG